MPHLQVPREHVRVLRVTAVTVSAVRRQSTILDEFVEVQAEVLFAASREGELLSKEALERAINEELLSQPFRVHVTAFLHPDHLQHWRAPASSASPLAPSLLLALLLALPALIAAAF